jgi:ABC-type amino acid transport substrate-binding protein
MKKQNLLLFLGLLVIVSMLLVACGGGEEATATPEPPVEKPTETPAEEMESPTIKAIKERGTLRLGAAIALPAVYKDPSDGKLKGVGVDMANEAAKRLGVDVEYIESSWDAIIAGLQANKYDAVVAGLYATEERKKVVDFVIWYEEGNCFLVRNDSPIHTLEDLNSSDVTIATITGSGSEQMVQANLPNAKIRSVPTATGGGGAPPEEVLSGRADASQFDGVLALAWDQRFPELRVAPDNCFEDPTMPTPVGIAINKGDPEWKTFWEEVVADLESQGLIKDWRAKYSGWEFVFPGEPTPVAEAPGAPAEVAAPAAGESPTVDAIREAGKLRAGVAVALPTLGQDPKTGEYFGPAVEIGRWAAEGLGVEFELVDSNWDTIIAGLQANKFELAIAGLYATPARREVVDFVIWTEMGFCHLVLKDNDKIQSLEDLNSPDVVGCQYTGTGTEQNVREKYPNAVIDSIVSPPGGETRIEEVLAGRCDFSTLDSPLIIVYQQEYPQIKVFPESAEYCFANPDMPTEVGVALNYGDEVFKSYVEAIINAHGDDIDELMIKYSAPEYLRPQE